MTRVARAIGLRRGADERDRARLGEDLGGRPATAQGYPSPMADRLRVACVQLSASGSKAENIERMEPLVARGGRRPAPTSSSCPRSGTRSGRTRSSCAVAEPLEGGETVEAMSALGANSTGSRSSAARSPSAARGARSSRTRASSSTPTARSSAVYRKIHMFDVEVGGPGLPRVGGRGARRRDRSCCEVEGWRVGLTVCYDLRFPELYRILALEGAELVTVPAAFTLYTGKDHWELLLRARAVENQCYVAAANQWGVHEGGQGVLRPLARSSTPGASCSRRRPTRTASSRPSSTGRTCERIRRSLPSLANRQPAAYRGRRRSRARVASSAVLFDVDFTLAKPGPLLGGPRATATAGARHGLDARPRALRGGARGGDPGPRAPPRARARRGDLGALHRGHRARHGRRGPARPRGRAGDHARLGAPSANFELYEDALPVLAELRGARPQHRARLEHEPRPGRSSSRHFSLDVDAWISSGVHGKVKPSPTIFRAVLELLEVEPGRRP